MNNKINNYIHLFSVKCGLPVCEKCNKKKTCDICLLKAKIIDVNLRINYNFTKKFRNKRK